MPAKTPTKLKLLSLSHLLILLLCGCAQPSMPQYTFPEIPSQATAADTAATPPPIWLKREGGMWDSLLLYSIPDESILEQYSPQSRIRDYAVTDSSIYYFDSGDLWRIDRETGEQEDTGARRVTRLAVCDGYIFYGDKEDIFVCPEDGDPATDGISLQEQFKQPVPEFYTEDAWPPKGEKQEICFQGWRITRLYRGGYSYIIWEIAEEESGRIIMGPEETNYFYSHGWPPDFTGSYTVRVDGEWITFEGPYWVNESEEPIIYRRNGETTEYPIQCLDENKYEYSRLGKDFTWEDGKLIGSITVCRGFRLYDIFLGKSSDDAVYDVLFELDIDADTSKVLFSTQKDQAQIVGYKSGKVYCYVDGRIYRESLADGTREKMIDLREGVWGQYWDEEYRKVQIYWQDDYMILYLGGQIKSYYIPD